MREVDWSSSACLMPPAKEAVALMASLRAADSRIVDGSTPTGG
jgi:hypothetical protein